MLLAKDLNSQSAPNFLNVSRKRNSDSSHNYDHRKPILKKNASPKFHHPQLNEEEKQYGKENPHKDKNNTLYASDVDESPGKTPSQLMRIIQKKKKSIFLELQQLRQSEKSQFSKKNRSNIKKISFRSIGSDSSEQTKLGFKQSKVDIIFSTSNLSESFWNPKDMPDFELPEKSLKDFRSSDVVEVVLPDSQFSKINLRKTDKKYTLKKSDRIIQEVDETKQDNKDSRVYKVRVFENTLSTKSNTAQNGFGMIQEQSFLKNGNVTSNTLASNKTKSITSNTIKNQQFTDDHSQFITIIQNPPKSKILNKSSSTDLIQHDILSRLPQNSSNGRSEIVLRSSRNRQLHENSINQEYRISDQKVKLKQKWKEELFCLVNLYRFFNRLEYQIGKYFTNLNQRIDPYSKQLISELNSLKYSMLLRAQKQFNLIKSSKEYSFVSSSDISLFNNLIQSYIMKQTLKLGTKIKLNTSIVSKNFTEIVVSFLKLTLNYLEPRINQVVRYLSHSSRTKETLILQHQNKILSYVFYDVFKRKINKLQNSTKSQNQRRMTQIIELNQWEQKVPLNQVTYRFEILKKDFNRQIILNSKYQ